MDAKGFLIRHGEKVGLGVLILFLLSMLVIGGPGVPGEMPDLDVMIRQVDTKIKETAEKSPPVSIYGPAWKLVEPDWLEIVKKAWTYPLGLPARELAFNKDNWMTEPRPKVRPPGELRFYDPRTLTAEGLPGAVKLEWLGAKQWVWRQSGPDGQPVTAESAMPTAYTGAVTGTGMRPTEIETKLYQITSEGVIEVKGFNLYRSAVGREPEKVNEELLTPDDVMASTGTKGVSAGGLPVGGLSGVMGGGVGPYGLGPGDDPRMAGPAGMMDPRMGMVPGGPMDGMPGMVPGMTPEMMPGMGVQQTARPTRVAFDFLDRDVYPEFEYEYAVEAVGEVLRVQPVKNPQDYPEDELAKRPEVGEILDSKLVAVSESVLVLEDTLLACMGGTPEEASIIVTKLRVTDDGEFEEATDQFSVRAGQEIGYPKKVAVKVPRQSVVGGMPGMGGQVPPMDGMPPELMMGPGGAMPPGGVPGGAFIAPMMPGGGREGYAPGGAGPGMRPQATGGRARGGRGAPGAAVESPGGRGGGRTGSGDRTTARSGSRGTGTSRGAPGRPGGFGMSGSFDEITKDVDFSTGMILLDIVPSSTEIKVAEREGGTVPRSFARWQYKIVVVDRLKRLKEHYKMGRSEAETMRLEAFGDLIGPKRGMYPGGMDMGPAGAMGPAGVMGGGGRMGAGPAGATGRVTGERY